MIVYRVIHAFNHHGSSCPPIVPPALHFADNDSIFGDDGAEHIVGRVVEAWLDRVRDHPEGRE